MNTQLIQVRETLAERQGELDDQYEEYTKTMIDKHKQQLQEMRR